MEHTDDRNDDDGDINDDISWARPNEESTPRRKTWANTSEEIEMQTRQHETSGLPQNTETSGATKSSADAWGAVKKTVSKHELKRA